MFLYFAHVRAARTEREITKRQTRKRHPREEEDFEQMSCRGADGAVVRACCDDGDDGGRRRDVCSSARHVRRTDGKKARRPRSRAGRRSRLRAPARRRGARRPRARLFFRSVFARPCCRRRRRRPTPARARPQRRGRRSPPRETRVGVISKYCAITILFSPSSFEYDRPPRSFVVVIIIIMSLRAPQGRRRRAPGVPRNSRGSHLRAIRTRHLGSLDVWLRPGAEVGGRRGGSGPAMLFQSTRAELAKQ